jgi:hypothetical protein
MITLHQACRSALIALASVKGQTETSRQMRLNVLFDMGLITATEFQNMGGVRHVQH